LFNFLQAENVQLRQYITQQQGNILQNPTEQVLVNAPQLSMVPNVPQPLLTNRVPSLATPYTISTQQATSMIDTSNHYSAVYTPIAKVNYRQDVSH
jgi:hypothetical protein